MTTGTALRFSMNGFDSGGIINSWNAGQWYHVLGSISSANGARLRVDGFTAQTNADLNPAPAGGNYVIGSFFDGHTAGFIGVMQDFVAGTDDLTQAEEVDLSNAILPLDATDFWPLDEGTGLVATSYGIWGYREMDRFHSSG